MGRPSNVVAGCDVSGPDGFISIFVAGNEGTGVADGDGAADGDGDQAPLPWPRSRDRTVR